jgi:hypothetical protein
MAFVRQASSHVDAVRPDLEGVAKNLVDRIWGPNGPAWGTTLAEIETLVVALRQVVSEQLLQVALQRQAEADGTPRPARFRDGPSGHGPTEAREPEPRLVTTRGGKPSGKSPAPTAPPVGGLFSPRSKCLGIDPTGHRPAAQAKVVYAGINNTSYERGEADLRELAEIEVKAKPVRRVSKHIGHERCRERDEAVEHDQSLPLVKRKEAPAGVTPPDLAVVGVDGGRLQIFDRAARGTDPPTGRTPTGRTPTWGRPTTTRTSGRRTAGTGGKTRSGC